ncbi:MAG: hypothetical protein JRI25_20465 [Deltaproteobacteria bacterium]|nr:hypothetical protein [Deltaproteobacteria bacterium]MBW2256948.1 hypothetical protein [Deltaproteobacteria bacterium]
MLGIELFIPLADNDGRRFGDDHHAAFEAGLAAIFGGCSRLPGAVIGAWEHEGRTYHDDSVVYLVALPSLLDGGKVRQAVEVAKRHYRQEAIFIRYLGQVEII